jgi:very-short-patch-repair endonuclease
MPRIYNLTELKDRRRQLRRHATPAELKLWYYLRHRRFRGLKFRRQYSVGSCIIDFYCPALHLGVEISGGQSYTAQPQSANAVRDKFLRHFGITIFRVSADDVSNDIYDVLTALCKIVDKLQYKYAPPMVGSSNSGPGFNT